MKKLCLIILLSLLGNTLYSQGEAANWFFGKQAGVSFSSGTPEVITYTPTPGTPIETLEGSSTISDAFGNLLFYSDGTRVWNKNHEIMPNGSSLKGHRSSTQSGIIVPNPDNDDIYYVFTVGTALHGGDPPTSGTQGFRYYTVDMSLDGGLGAVVSGSEVNLSDGKESRWTEKVTAVRQDDCGDYWVISLVDNSGSESDDYTSTDYSSLNWDAGHDWGSTFYAYRVSGTGVDLNPIKSQTPVDADEVKGYLKVSPNGQYISIANYAYSLSKKAKTYLFSLDLDTGLIGEDDDDLLGLLPNQRGLELMSRTDISTYGAPYGIEFDGTSRFLYVSTHDSNTGNWYDMDGDDEISILQYDLEALDIKNSQTQIHYEYGNVYRAGLQLSYGNQIYVTVPRSYYTDTQYLDLIEFPYLKGTDANYIESYVDLGTGRATQGLPPFIQSLFLQELNITNNGDIDDNRDYLYLCEGDNYTIKHNVNYNPAWTYTWTKDGVLLPTETTEQLTISYDGSNAVNKYTLEVNKNDGTCPKIGTSIITFSPPPTAGTPSNIFECDDDVDGFYTFDLTNNDNLILNGLDPSLYTVEYYESEADALGDIEANMILDPSNYTNKLANTLETIYARLESVDLASCSEIVQFDINVTTVPEASTPVDYIECDSDIDGFDDNGSTFFDLSSKDIEVLGGLDGSRYEVSYHLSQADADAGINDLEKNTPYASGSVTIYVRLENLTNTACVDTSVTFDLIVNPLPALNVDSFNQIDCDNDGLDGADFKDLRDFVDVFIANSINYNITYHHTQATAELGIEPINNPENYYATTETIYIRFENKTTLCYEIGVLNIDMRSADVSNTIEHTLVECDVNQTGIASFDINVLYDAFVSDNPYIANSGAVVKFYSTETDAANDTNAIVDWNNANNIVAYDDILYIRVENGTCFDYGKFAKLEVEPLPLASATASDIKICDTDQDGFYNDFRLDDVRSDILKNNAPGDYDISFYNNTTDRISDSNRLGDSYTNFVAFGNTVYVRIENIHTGCINLNLQFNVQVLPPPLIETNIGLQSVCDLDNNGYAQFDFNNSAEDTFIQDLILNGLNPLDYQVQYFTSEPKAQNNIDPLLLPYTNGTAFDRETLWARVSNLTTGCFSIMSFDIQVNNAPLFNPPMDYEQCDNADDLDADNGIVNTFVMNTKDSELFPIAIDRDQFNISYHPTQNDADLNTNVINKDLGYQNTTADIQTIFVRMENKNDPTCYDTTTFNLIVNPLPEVKNDDFDWVICDDDTTETTNYDLSDILADISTNPAATTISFYSTADAALNDVSSLKLPNVQINSPSRTFFARHENASGCIAVSRVNAIVVATAIPSSFQPEFEQCDIDENGIAVFDFSQAQTDLIANYTHLDSPEVTLSYYNNLTDAQNQDNAIADLANHSINTAYNQTIFVRVDNQGCFYIGEHINLIVNPLPLVTSTVDDLEVCDDDNDGLYDDFRLDLQRNQILNGENPADYTISFYDNPSDRTANTNALGDVYQNSTPGGNTIYVRIIDLNTGCINDNLSFQTIVNPLPVIASSIPTLVICDLDNDNRYDFDFDNNLDQSYISDQILDGLNPADYSISYHSSEAAATAASPLTLPYTNTASNETLWARVDNLTTGCFSIMSFDIQVNNAPLFNPPMDYEQCDNADDLDADNGIVNTFVMNTKDSELFPIAIDRDQFNISYHPTQNDADLNTNVINKDLGYQNTTADIQTIFVRMENKNDPNCYDTTTFNLIVNPLPGVKNDDFDWIICDYDTTESTNYDLADILSDISTDPAATTISFYLSEDAALNDDTSLKVSNTLQADSPSRTFFARHENASGCIAVSRVNAIVVATAIPSSFQPEFEQCDIDENGIAVFDFTQAQTDLIANYTHLDSPEVTLSYYNNLTDAQNQDNAIADLANHSINTAYNQTIFVRVDNQGCFYIGEHINLIVNPLPLVTSTVDDLEVCDDDNDGLYDDFRLDLQRNQILNGENPADYTISFYDNPADRIANTNALGDTYKNINPDGNTVYVRIIDLNTGCINDNLSFETIVNPLPVIASNIPTLVICDLDNDNRYDFDFDNNLDQSYISDQILDGLNPADYSISYHSSEAAAIAASPMTLPYTNTASNETLWARVDNLTTGCFSIMSFDIQVNNAPLFNPPSDYEQCDNADDLDADNGIVNTFVMNTKDSELFPIAIDREQFNISYHASQSDADLKVNIINKDLGYQNTTADLQTIFVRMENKNDPTCYDTTTFNLIVNPLPEVKNDNFDWIICDDDVDGKVSFELMDIIDEISTNPADSTISFFTGETAAYENDRNLEISSYQINSGERSIFVRHENASGCVVVSQVNIVIISTQISSRVQEELILCDLFESPTQNDKDGISIFDLGPYNAQIESYFDGIPNLSITHYPSLDDAENATNSIQNLNAYRNDLNHTDPSGIQAIYTRVEAYRNGALVEECIYIGTHLSLKVNPIPLINTSIDPIELCDDDYDGQMVFNLKDKRDELEAINPNFKVSFYLNQNDAANDIDALGDSYESHGERIFIRLTDLTLSDQNGASCPNTEYFFDLVVKALPYNQSIADLEFCAVNFNDTIEVDLHSRDGELLQGFGPELSIKYYENSADAENEVSEISTGGTSYAFNQEKVKLYAVIQDYSTAGSCPSIVSFILKKTLSPDLNPITDYSACELFDGTQSFDLNGLALELLGNAQLSTGLFTIEFYQANGQQIIDLSNYIITQDETIRVVVYNTTNPDCAEEVNVNLVIDPQPEVLIENYDYILCDDDLDGITNFDLTQVQSAISATPNVRLKFYLNEEDASSDQNQIISPENFSNSNYTTIYVRHEIPGASDCAAISKVNLKVAIYKFDSRIAQTLYQCDDQVDGDSSNGISSFDIRPYDTAVKNLYPSDQQIQITHYRTVDDANNNVNPIAEADYSNFRNTDSPNQQLIYTRAVNLLAPHCSVFVASYLTLEVQQAPEIQNVQLNTCFLDDINSVNQNTAVFDLESALDDILLGEDPANFDISFHHTFTLAQLNDLAIEPSILNNYNNTVQDQIVFVRIADQNSGCTSIAELTLHVDPLPVVPMDLSPIELCDITTPTNIINDNVFLITDLNSHVQDELLSLLGEKDNYELEFYATSRGAQEKDYQDRVASPYQITRAIDTVYTTVTDLRTGCFVIRKFTTQLFDAASPSPIPAVEVCDDAAVDGNDENGVFYNFDLSTLDSELLINQVNSTNFEVTYYASQEDADLGINALDKNAFNNEQSPHNQTIYTRVVNTLNPTCADTSISFEFIVHTLPGVNTNPETIIGCDYDKTDTFIFNLLDLKYNITENEDLHPHISYYSTEAGARDIMSETDRIPSSLLTNYEVTSRSVWARISRNGCYKFSELVLEVAPLPEYMTPLDLEVCDDGSLVDLDQLRNEVLSNQPEPELFDVYFYASLYDAENDVNAIDQLRTDQVSNADMELFIRVVNTYSGCGSIDYASFRIRTNPMPEFDIISPIVFCDNDPEIDVFIEQEDLNTYEYTWIDPDGQTLSPQDARGTHVVLKKAGTYIVLGTNPETGCTTENHYEAHISEIAKVDATDVIINDDYGNNSVQIRKDRIGTGNYLFAIDDVNGPYNDTGYFDQLSIGTHIIYIKDELGCEIVEVQVTILDFPAYFTPEDYINKRWNVQGIEDIGFINEFKSGMIDIFDRYGKYITSIDIYGEGWDGTFKGQKLLPTDYWYHAKLVDQNGLLREYQGHFSLVK